MHQLISLMQALLPQTLYQRSHFTKEIYAVLDGKDGTRRYGRITLEVNNLILHSANTRPPPATALLVDVSYFFIFVSVDFIRSRVLRLSRQPYSAQLCLDCHQPLVSRWMWVMFSLFCLW